MELRCGPLTVTISELRIASPLALLARAGAFYLLLQHVPWFVAALLVIGLGVIEWDFGEAQGE